jgi:predicted Zn-dependent protease
MKKYILLSVSLISVSFYSCTKNGFSNRNQLSLISESQVQQMAVSEYTNFLSTNKVVPASSNKNSIMVRNVAARIITAVNTYAQQNNLQKSLEGFAWEVNLVEDNNINAWCMPGGKIVVYTGILPVTQNENALAVVMGHEICHALLKHGSERMSQGMLSQFGSMALSEAVRNKPAETQALFNAAFGLGIQYGATLPFSRSNELEADKYGLIFAALAGYDPREAVPFWTRMSQQGGQKPPEFASTHPSDERRISELKAMMNEVMTKYYKPVKK